MKLPLIIKVRLPSARIAGFTLVETMVSLWIFIIIFVGVMVGLQVFGLRTYTLGATKLSAAACGLKVLDHIRDDIRQAKVVNVGTLTTTSDPSTFTNPATGYNTGSALQIYPTTNATAWTIYYLDTSTPGTNYLKMASTTDGSTFSVPTTLASYITNQIVFDAEDYQGNILTNNTDNRVIRMELDFYQWEYPIGYVGGIGANAYDFYRLTTKITLRDLD